ncbi:hypothetical protein IC575_017218 [Cucumis melo]
MSRLFTEREKQMNNHPLPEEIEEFLESYKIHSFFFSEMVELHMGSNAIQRSTRDRNC